MSSAGDRDQQGVVVHLLEPRAVFDLNLATDETSLILSKAGLEERFGLRDIAVRERKGDVVRFSADGIDFALQMVDTHPLDVVDMVLDARAAARGNVITTTRQPRNWPEIVPPPGPALERGDDPDSVSDPRTSRAPTRRRRILIIVSGIVLAVLAGAFVGDMIDEMSGPGVGDSVELGGRLVVRDVTGVGDDTLSPFSATGPWELTWENHGAGPGLTVTAISEVDRSETPLVVGETGDVGVAGPIPAGVYRLSIVAEGGWRIVVSVEG